MSIDQKDKYYRNVFNVSTLQIPLAAVVIYGVNGNFGTEISTNYSVKNGP